MFGGLGKVGLDYKHQSVEEGADYEVPAFSNKLQHLASSVKAKETALKDEDMLIADFEDMDDDLEQIDDDLLEEKEESEEEI